MTNPQQWIDELNSIKASFNRSIQRLKEEVNNMALDLTALTAEVTQTATVEASAVALIDALVDELKANANDPVAIAALAAQLHAATAPLASAVAANPVSNTVVANTTP